MGTRSGRAVNGVKKLPESMYPRGEIGHALFREQQDASGRLDCHPSYAGYLRGGRIGHFVAWVKPDRHRPEPRSLPVGCRERRAGRLPE